MRRARDPTKIGGAFTVLRKMKISSCMYVLVRLRTGAPTTGAPPIQSLVWWCLGCQCRKFRSQFVVIVTVITGSNMTESTRRSRGGTETGVPGFRRLKDDDLPQD